jgi:hypothetical protein
MAEPKVGDIIWHPTDPDKFYEVYETSVQSIWMRIKGKSYSTSWITHSDFEDYGWIIGIPETQDKKQVGGDHYTKHKIMPWDIIDEYGLDFYAGNAIKYILRAPDKNGVEDLEKAKHYLERMIERAKQNG